MKVTLRTLAIPALAVLWLVGFSFGARYLLRFEKTAGATAETPMRWPDGLPDSGKSGLPTLVVALHPRCSCSGASLIELERAAKTFSTPFNTVMLIYQPANETGEWRNDDLYRDAQSELHALIVPDTDGALSAKFGAETSGEVMLYSPQDRSSHRSLLYAGGVTGARGMEGENQGANALVSAFANQRRETNHPVFGCSFRSLFDRQPTSLAAVRPTDAPIAQREAKGAAQ